MKKLIVIADWAGDAVYCAEYASAIGGYSNDINPAEITFIPVNPSSIHAGFIIEQIALTEERLGRPQNLVIHMASEQKSRDVNFLVIKLVSGIYVAGLNNGCSYSFIKDSIDEAFTYTMKAKSSNFLSRDVYSRAVVQLIESRQDDLELEELHTSSIDQASGYFVGHIDGFGNIITTIKHEVLSAKYTERDEVSVTIGSSTKKAIYHTELLSRQDNELHIGPSSFGSPDNLYCMIMKRIQKPSDSSAVALFSDIYPGVEISFK